MVDTKSACDKAAGLLTKASGHFPRCTLWVSHKAASFAALYCFGMRLMLSPSGTSLFAVSSQGQCPSRLLSDKQVAFTTSPSPFPVPSLRLISPQVKGATMTVQDPSSQ